MRSVVVLVLGLALASPVRAEEQVETTGVLDGQAIAFPETSRAAGAQAALRLLESCHDESPFEAAELKKAKKGDHVRLVFDEPASAEVLDHRVKVSELVIRLPINTGVFWVRSGPQWRRYTKFEFQKQEAFEDWLRLGRPVD